MKTFLFFLQHLNLSNRYGKPNVPAETLDLHAPRSQLLDDTLYT
jgi:hypothetical protein